MKVGHSLEEILKLRHRLVSLTTDYRNRQVNQSCNQIYLRNIHLLVFHSARSIAGQALQPLGSLFSFSGKPVGFLLAFREWGPYKLQKQWWSAHFRGSGQPAQYDLPKH